MKQGQGKIKYGNVDLGPEYFEAKNQKHRVTTFIDGDVLEWLKSEGSKVNLGYQTLLNMKLREAMSGGGTKQAMKDALEELFADGKLVLTHKGKVVRKGTSKPKKKSG